eukprot:m.74706 g.74706  ORF g.74706 m.74706 type:complete len:178 (-) comp14528_c1_seq1:597-1130(-)
MLVGDAAQPLQRLLGTYRSRMGGSLAFTPDGRWAVTGTNTQRLLWWDLETGTLVHVHYTAAATPAAPAASAAAVASVRSIRYFPGGKQMVSCADRAVYIWTLCHWSDRTHRLFAPAFKSAVFTLMCVRQRLEHAASKPDPDEQLLPCLPLELWLLIFVFLNAGWRVTQSRAAASWVN